MKRKKHNWKGKGGKERYKEQEWRDEMINHGGKYGEGGEKKKKEKKKGGGRDREEDGGRENETQ